MSGRFRNKAVIVTGGAAGIGRATALAFGREGAMVAVADLDLDRAEETAGLIREEGSEAIVIKTDVGNDADVASMVSKCLEVFGRLDVAFNNAGIEGKTAETHECAEENWDLVTRVNLKGTWLCMRHEIPPMLKRGGGSIVNMASVAGLAGFAGMPAYTAAKHGIVGLSRAAALELASKKIRVNVVCPGVIQTEMIDRFTEGKAEALETLVSSEPIGRVGTPNEVADAVLFLASPEASFILGHALAIDGGMLAE